jgi:hypothetical protein
MFAKKGASLSAFHLTPLVALSVYLTHADRDLGRAKLGDPDGDEDRFTCVRHGLLPMIAALDGKGTTASGECGKVMSFFLEHDAAEQEIGSWMTAHSQGYEPRR